MADHNSSQADEIEVRRAEDQELLECLEHAKKFDARGIMVPTGALDRLVREITATRNTLAIADSIIASVEAGKAASVVHRISAYRAGRFSVR